MIDITSIEKSLGKILFEEWLAQQYPHLNTFERQKLQAIKDYCQEREEQETKIQTWTRLAADLENQREKEYDHKRREQAKIQEQKFSEAWREYEKLMTEQLKHINEQSEQTGSK